jgi:hypothetical protein
VLGYAAALTNCLLVVVIAKDQLPHLMDDTDNA